MPASISDLPDELLILISSHITSEKDLSAFHQTNHRHYCILHDHLYRHNAQHHGAHALFWAAKNGQPNTARNSVLAGTSLDPLPWPFTWTRVKEVSTFWIRLWGRYEPEPKCPMLRDENGNWIEDPMTSAAKAGHASVVKVLLEMCDYPRIPNAPSIAHPKMVLHAAVDAGETQTVKVLLDGGLDPNYLAEPMMPMLSAAAIQGTIETVELLLRYGAQLEGGPRWKPLHSAALVGHVDIMRLLLDQGADINASITSGQLKTPTPIVHAALHCQYRAVELLVYNGADLNQRDPFNGRTALFYMVRHGKIQTVEKLLEKGAHIDTDSLFEAVSDCYFTFPLPIMKLLLKYGANPNTPLIRNGNKYFALPLAARRYRADAMCELLLDYGADPNLRGSKESCPILMYAVSWQNQTLVAKMLKSGADPNAVDRNMNMPLYLSVVKGDTCIARLLLQYGANPKAVRDGVDLVSWARKMGNREMVDLLVEYGC